MTLNDIGRMMKLAKVPRSKTVQVTYPSPGFIIHVPHTHYFIVAEVVGRLKLRTDNIQVSYLESKDARPGKAPAEVNIPFDEEAVRAGKPIEVLFDGKWYDAHYIGKSRSAPSDHAVEVIDKPADMSPNPNYWGVDAMRMKAPIVQQVQMFANVYRDGGVCRGYLKASEEHARKVATKGAIAVAVPVTITVTKE